MNLGYLSPSGQMYVCDYFGHLELARKICNTYEKPFIELMNSSDCELYLLDIGYVCIRSRSVEYRPFTTRKFGSHFGAKVCVNLLTDAQNDFIRNLFETKSWYNIDQMDSAQMILDYDECLRDGDIELKDGEIMNPLNTKI